MFGVKGKGQPGELPAPKWYFMALDEITKGMTIKKKKAVLWNLEIERMRFQETRNIAEMEESSKE